MAVLSPDRRVERHGFFKINPIIIIVLFIIFVPISYFVDVCFFSSKINRGIPSLMNFIVAESNIDIDQFDIKEGDKLIFTNFAGFAEDTVALFYEPTEEETDTGSPIRVGLIKQISYQEGQTFYGIKGYDKYIIEEAMIGTFVSNSSFFGSIITFASSKFALVFLSLVPSSTILILLILDIIEIFNIKKINNELQLYYNDKEKQKIENLNNDKVENENNTTGEEKNQTDEKKQQIEKTKTDKDNKSFDTKQSNEENSEIKDIKQEKQLKEKTKNVMPVKPQVKEQKDDVKQTQKDKILSSNKQEEQIPIGQTETNKNINTSSKPPAKAPVKPPVKAPAKPPVKPPVTGNDEKQKNSNTKNLEKNVVKFKVENDEVKVEVKPSTKTTPSKKVPIKPPVKPDAEKTGKLNTDKKQEKVIPAKPPVRPNVDEERRTLKKIKSTFPQTTKLKMEKPNLPPKK